MSAALRPALLRTIVFAGNPVKCAQFYVERLGMKRRDKWFAEWAQVEGAGAVIAFHQACDAKGKPVRRRAGSPRHPHKLAFTVRDVAKARAALIAKGVRMKKIRHFPEQSGLILCDGSDPEGNVFQLCNH